MRYLVLVLAVGGCFGKPDFSGAHGDGGVDGTIGAMTNRIFVSSEKVIPGMLGGIAKADERCQRLAMTAGYQGDYMAWLSTSTQSAEQRILARGMEPAGWVRPDGKPVANSLDDLARGRHFYPVRYTEKLEDLYDSDEAVITATLGNTNPEGDTCGDYMSTSGTIFFGIADTEGRGWTEFSAGACSDARRLYCLGVSFSSMVDVTPPANARTVFVSQTIDPSRGTGDFTAKCNADAVANSITGTFVAGVATTTASIESFIPLDRPFVRLDGVVVLEAGLAKMQAPVALDANKRHVDSGIATGARLFNTPAASNETCVGWTSKSSTDHLSVGWSMRSYPGATLFDHLGDCSEPALRVYCFQTTP